MHPSSPSAIPVGPRARLSLLGGFRVCASDGDVALRPAAERLLAFLALSRRPVDRARLAGTLWPDTTDDRALARLRALLWRLPRPGGPPLVAAGPAHVALPDRTDVDLWRLEALARDTGAGVEPVQDADPTPSTDPTGLVDPVDEAERALLAGELLPGWTEEWVLVERERHRQLLLHGLEELCDRRRRQGRYADAVRLGLHAVAQEPLRESSHRRVVEVHLAEGNAGEALAQYQSFRRLLQVELGLAPSPAIRALVAPLLARPLD